MAKLNDALDIPGADGYVVRGFVQFFNLHFAPEEARVP